ncbi:M4 family metallopeptidase [Fontimonas thermophila]|nr:M4 family metallopeptidase [Fontimonas thermophila]
MSVHHRLHRFICALSRTALLACALPGLASALPERTNVPVEELLRRLQTQTGGALISVRRAQDAYFAALAQGGALLYRDDASGPPVERALGFLSLYGALVGATDPAAQLRAGRISHDRRGGTHVHLDQIHRGLPVFGARLVVHMNANGITGISGVFIDDLDTLSTTPALSVRMLRERALAAVRKQHPRTGAFEFERTRLMIYRSGLLKGVPGTNHLAYEALIRVPGAPIRERVIIDAHTGALLTRINEIHSILNREIYTPTMDVPPLLTEGSALAPADPPLVGDVVPSTRTADLPTNNLYIFAGGTYALYKNLFGREGYDDGAVPPAEQVQRSVYLINEQCPNAYWDGTSTNYCPGFDADDVVSHEWSHAYTEYTHGLVYQYQSGALNESYSDIFGEAYDLVNGLEGPLGFTLTEGEYFENGGSRWVVGEDLSETAASLLLRDMWDPDNFTVNVPLLGIPVTGFAPSPGSVITSPNYYCGTGDNGGVHTNSGVPNHAFAMLVDGKTFNGVTIPGIGLTKSLHIYFHAATHYQTPTTNFAQHADALEQSCRDLIGVALNDVLGNPSGEVIGAADCEAVHLATVAVEFRDSPKEKCNYLPVLQPESETPALCPQGQAPEPSLHENWENGIPATWTLGKNLTGDTESEGFAFVATADLPAPHGGHAAFAVDDTGGTCAPGGDLSGSHWMDSPIITVGPSSAFLHFSHFMQSEAGYDGGNLKFSLNGGEFTPVPNDAFEHNPHSGEFAPGPILPLPVPDPTGLTGNNTNPLAGEPAWTGADQGEATGSWGISVVSFEKLGAVPGDTLRFRWEFGQDGCGGNLGWYVDDVTVYACKVGGSGIPPIPSAGSASGGHSAGKPDAGRFGGALGLWCWLPLAMMAALRRRTRR